MFHRITLALGLLALPFAANAEQHADPEHVKQAIAANSLDVEGKVPFHLKMTFQMYDLNGKESEAGTIEEWWAAPGVHHLEIKSPSYNFTAPSDVPVSDIPSREKFLVNMLRGEALSPLPDMTRNHLPIAEDSRSFGKIKLTCWVAIRTDPTISGRPPENYCFDPVSYALRVEFEPGVLGVTRNSLGIFKETHVALDIHILYNEKLAITGKFTTLETFDPTKSSLAMTKPPDPLAPSQSSPMSGVAPGAKGLTAGHIIAKYQPVYPDYAKASHISGTVIVEGLISPKGTVENITPIASPDDSLTQAAVNAVKKWIYQPYLLNGQPTSVDTTIYINFNLR
jgi:TonB family protein